MKKDKRYCIEKLTAYDYDKKVETWIRTRWCNDKDSVLDMFLAEDHRIFDIHENKELRRGHFNPESWKVKK